MAQYSYVHNGLNVWVNGVKNTLSAQSSMKATKCYRLQFLDKQSVSIQEGFMSCTKKIGKMWVEYIEPIEIELRWYQK